MTKIIDLIGQRFIRLVVIGRAINSPCRHSRWLCLCNCGNKIVVQSNSLKSGNTKSCGCLFREGNNIKHGHTKNGRVTLFYKVWDSMVQRCVNPNNKDYHNYGGRGITACKEWLKFENFNKDMRNGWKPGLQIDRENNNQGYHPGNCQWVTTKINNRNKRNNNLITHDGKTQCLVVWAEEYQISYSTLWKRLYKYNWSIEKALMTPSRKWENKK